MHQLDALIDRFAAGRISRRGLVKGAAALGVSGAALQALERSNIVVAQPAENSILWVSPRGTLEVLDDYAYWVAVKMGYFGDIETSWSRADRGHLRHQGGRQRPGRHGLPLARRLLAGDRAGQSLWSPSGEMGAYDVFDFAFRKGQAPASVTDLEGKTDRPRRSAGWQGIVDPMIAQAGGDPHHGQVRRRRSAAGARRWRRARPTPRSPGQGCARSGPRSGSTSTTSWARTGRSSRPTRSRSAAPTSRTRRSPTSTPATSAAGRMGLEFGYQNPRAATQITM